jgi:hypothetical protein
MTKSFKRGFESLLGGTKEEEKKETRGRPKTNFKTVTKTSEAGTKESETRATFIVNKDLLEDVKAVAHWERITIKEVLAEALKNYLDGKKRELPNARRSYRGKPEEA